MYSAAGDNYFGGNVGIGEADPRAPLAFAATTSTAGLPSKIRLYDNGISNLYGFGVSSGQLDIVSGTSGNIAFWNNSGSNQNMTINSSGNVEFRAGTAALPALTTTGDTNTGIFFPAADTIAFAEGGAEAMRINSSGNVGIGTTANYRLAVVGGATQLSGSTDAAAGLRVQTASGVATLTGINSDNNAFNPIAFYTASAEAARIDTSSNFYFDSGYGSSAVAYGCRAWVNFNLAATPSIRADGNVTSLTDGGSGIVTVNFTTAMPDANYACIASGSQTDAASANEVFSILEATAPTTSAVKLISQSSGGNNVLALYCSVAIFR